MDQLEIVLRDNSSGIEAVGKHLIAGQRKDAVAALVSLLTRIGTGCPALAAFAGEAVKQAFVPPAMKRFLAAKAEIDKELDREKLIAEISSVLRDMLIETMHVPSIRVHHAVKEEILAGVASTVRAELSGFRSEFLDGLSRVQAPFEQEVFGGRIPSRVRPLIDSQPAWEAMLGAVLGGKYTLVEFLGMGGAGGAFRARDPLGAEVCAKIFYSIPAEQLARLATATETAARVLAQVSHPHLAKVLGFGFLEGRDFCSAYVVSDLIPGDSLWSWCARAYETRQKRESSIRLGADRSVAATGSEVEFERRQLTKKVGIAARLAAAIDYVHNVKYLGATGFESRGLPHGDLTPQNVIMTNDVYPVVIDFMMPDLQRLIASDDPLERDERWKKRDGHYVFTPYTTGAYGTPGWMPPEQASEGIVSARSDIYTLGLTFAHLFFLEFIGDNYGMPFVHAWQAGLRLSRHGHVSGHVEREYAALERIVEDMTAVQPNQRPESLESVVHRLEELDG